MWRLLWKAEALFLVLMMGCSSIPKVPLVEDNGQGRAVVLLPRTADVQPVVVDREEFQQALRRLAREVRLSGTPRQTVEKMFQMDPQYGNYLWLQKDRKLVPLGPGEPPEGALTKDDLETAERYRLWCQRVHNVYGDCLGGALVAGRYLDMHGRYIWALALSKSPVIDVIYEELDAATATCRSIVECREGLTRALKALAKEIATPGTELNQLVTRQQPR